MNTVKIVFSPTGGTGCGYYLQRVEKQRCQNRFKRLQDGFF